jgi:hypothetical protein
MNSSRTNKINIKNWDKTLKLYVDWVANSDLRKYFSDEIKINNFSLWWATNITAKDNMINNKWYYDLKDCLFENKKIKSSKFKFYLIFFARLLKNFITHCVWYSVIKILSFSRYKKIRRKNCFHTFDVNFLKKGDSFIDRCYGNAPFSNYKNDNFFLITTIKKRNFFSNFFKKKSIPCVNAAEYLSVFDVFNIYYKILISFFKLKIFLNKNKKIFFIKNVDCRNVLEPFLLMSFTGDIQYSIFNGLSVRNFLKCNKEVKLFISYGEFNPGFRSLHFFVKDLVNPPKHIAIQHGHANQNLGFFFHKKKEFTKNQLLRGSYYSPSPDFYLTQGNQYNKILNNYFPNETKIIGCLKYDIYNFQKKKKNTILKKIKFKKGVKNKKIILLCPSIGDELVILDYLRQSVNFNFRFILSPHPVFKEKIIRKYLYELKDKCYLEVYNDVSTIDLLSIADLVICGFSTIAYEALFFGVQSIRIINSDNPHFFDLRDNLPVADSPNSLKKILNTGSFLKTKATAVKKLKRNYFYKLDNKAYLRFWNFIKEQKL